MIDRLETAPQEKRASSPVFIIDEAEGHAVERLLRLALRESGARLFAGRLHSRPGTAATSRSTGRCAGFTPGRSSGAIAEIELFGGAVLAGTRRRTC